MSKLTEQQCKEAEKDSRGCLGYSRENDDEPVEQCKQCNKNTMHEVNCCGSTIIDRKADYRKATATKGGKIHWAWHNMSLCAQYVGDNTIEGEVTCKRCLKLVEKSGLTLVRVVGETYKES